ncbi:hypothetical protein ACLB2K_037615 [Fragaria x ananassa]
MPFTKDRRIFEALRKEIGRFMEAKHYRWKVLIIKLWLGGRRGREVAWRRLEHGVVKLNIDGVLDHQNGVFGIGAICKNENGDCLGVLAAPGTSFLSPHSCEFLALVNGLHFCTQSGFARVEVESDSQASDCGSRFFPREPQRGWCTCGGGEFSDEVL